MLREYLSGFGINNFTGQRTKMSLQEPGCVTIGNEANIVAVWLLRDQ
jgi:hypothetical protein